VGVSDPHLWTDPLTMQQAVAALAVQLKTDLGVDFTPSAQLLGKQLDSLNIEITSMVNSLPEGNRKLVTGHDSLGYFADRYGLTLVGAIIPA